MKKIDVLLDKVRPRQMEKLVFYFDYGDGDLVYYGETECDMIAG